MKQFLSATAFVMCLLFTLGSCKIYDCGPSGDNTLYETIHANETYTYDLGSFGREEGASIIRQAEHYRVSRVYRQHDGSSMIYEYKPERDYLGVDEVEIHSERGSDGASQSDEIVNTTIRFRIIP